MKNLGRKLYHVLGGLGLLAMYICLGRTLGLGALLAIFLVVTAADFIRLRNPAINEFFFRYFKQFIRDNERDTLTGTPWYVLGILLVLLLYHLPAAVYGVLFLSVGDVAATSVGQRWGSIKISGKKSLQGTAAFLISALAAGLLVSHFYMPVVSGVIFAGAAAATLMEILPVPVNDNLTIPLVSGFVMEMLLTLL